MVGVPPHPRTSNQPSPERKRFIMTTSNRVKRGRSTLSADSWKRRFSVGTRASFRTVTHHVIPITEGETYDLTPSERFLVIAEKEFQSGRPPVPPTQSVLLHENIFVRKAVPLGTSPGGSDAWVFGPGSPESPFNLQSLGLASNLGSVGRLLTDLRIHGRSLVPIASRSSWM